jgi:hypothetical protein
MENEWRQTGSRQVEKAQSEINDVYLWWKKEESKLATVELRLPYLLVP